MAGQIRGRARQPAGSAGLGQGKQGKKPKLQCAERREKEKE